MYSGDNSQQRAFTGAIWADDPYDFARVRRERHVFKRPKTFFWTPGAENPLAREMPRHQYPEIRPCNT